MFGEFDCRQDEKGRCRYVWTVLPRKGYQFHRPRGILIAAYYIISNLYKMLNIKKKCRLCASLSIFDHILENYFWSTVYRLIIMWFFFLPPAFLRSWSSKADSFLFFFLTTTTLQIFVLRQYSFFAHSETHAVAFRFDQAGDYDSLAHISKSIHNYWSSHHDLK